MCFERDPECLACQDTKEKQVNVASKMTTSDFVNNFILAKGSLDLTVSPSKTLDAPIEPVVYDSAGSCFYCCTGALAALKGKTLRAITLIMHYFEEFVSHFLWTHTQHSHFWYLVFLPVFAYILTAEHLSEPLSSLVDNGEVITIMDAVWGKNVKRCLKVKYV